MIIKYIVQASIGIILAKTILKIWRMSDDIHKVVSVVEKGEEDDKGNH